MNCPICGYENEKDAQFCASCGKRLQGRYPITVTVQPMERGASRVELFVRIVYGFVLGIIAGIWGFFVFLALIIQWFFILIIGEREPGFWSFTTGFLRFTSKISGYMMLLTDQRPPISSEDDPYPVRFSASYEKEASRLELLIRIVYGLFLGIIAWIWGFFVSCAVLIHWFYILIIGERHSSLWNFTAEYTRFYYRVMGYLYLFTDERPPISGEEL